MIYFHPNLFHFKAKGLSFYRTSTFQRQRQHPQTQGCHSAIMGSGLYLWVLAGSFLPSLLGCWPVDFKLQRQTQRFTETVKPALATG